VSYLLELLGKGLNNDLGDVLDRWFWSPQTQSLQQLRDSCDEHPDWPDLQFKLGLAYLRAMQLDEAIRHLEKACRRKPDYLAARLALASAYEENSDPARALDQLKIANQTHSGEVPILFAIGFCLEKLSRPGDAAEYYRDAIAREPSFMAARERLAALAVFLGDLDEAIDQYQAIRETEPQKCWVHTALAHLYYRAGNYAQAVEAFETAIAMEPENWALLDDQVEALVAEGRIREAIERLHSLIEAQGSFADLRVRLADLYSQIGDDDAAMKHYLAALELQPDYLEASVKLGTHHLIFGRWEEAAEAFHAAGELNDRLLINYVGLGVCQAAGGDLPLR